MQNHNLFQVHKVLQMAKINLDLWIHDPNSIGFSSSHYDLFLCEVW